MFVVWHFANIASTFVSSVHVGFEGVPSYNSTLQECIACSASCVISTAGWTHSIVEQICGREPFAVITALRHGVHILGGTCIV